MYKFLLAFLCCVNSIYACDFCGCSPEVMNTDILSIQPQSSVGTSVQYRRFNYLHSDVNLKRTQIVTQNFFASYAPAKWADIRISLPVIWISNNYKTLDVTTPSLKERKAGTGDIVLFSNFRAMAKPAIGGKKAGHIINAGFGMSFPSGTKKSSENVLLQNFIFGTQTVAFFFSGTYSLSIRNWSLVNAALVKLNVYNKDNVKYGNMYSYQLSGNYTHYIKKTALSPVIGIRTDISQKNQNHHILQNKSGGWLMALDIGLQCTVKGCSVNVSVSQPLAQKIAAGNISQRTGFTCTARYQIKKRTKIINDTPVSAK